MSKYFILLLIMVSRGLLGSIISPASGIPEKAQVRGITGYPQKYNLSCESRSAVDVARFWGVRISETRFLKRLPRSDNPERGFVGDPNGYWGYTPPLSYGVHAVPVAETLSEFGLLAEAHKDFSWDDLRAEIAQGRPVIVWVTGHMWGGKAEEYRAKDGETVTVARFEHSMVLVGYDDQKVYVIDASYGKREPYPIKDFLRSWDVLGRMAVTVSGAIPLPGQLFTAE